MGAGTGAGGPSLRIVVLGNAAWSVPSIDALARSEHEVVRVLTRSPRPAGRGRTPAPTPVATAARELRLPLQEVSTVREGPGHEAIANATPDVLVVVAYGEILPAIVLAIPRLMPVNVHFSELPALRGAAPVQRAILDGLTRTGVTTMRMDEGMDTGPVLLQRATDIGEDEDAGALGGRLATMGGALLVETLDRLSEGSLEERPQDESMATIAPRLTPADERIDWSRPAAEVARTVRGLSPAPGAATSLAGTRLKIYRASPVGPAWPGAVPGELRGGSAGPLVATGDGAVLLGEVQAQGRRRISGADWARGARLREGSILG